MSRRSTRAAFTTLSVPIFFVALYAVTLAAGPVALLAAPVLFRLALAIVPPPTKLRLPTCPHLIRRDLEHAARLRVRSAIRARLGPSPSWAELAGVGAEIVAAVRDAREAARGAQAHEEVRLPVPVPPAPVVVPATSADARRAEAPPRRAAA